MNLYYIITHHFTMQQEYKAAYMVSWLRRAHYILPCIIQAQLCHLYHKLPTTKFSILLRFNGTLCIVKYNYAK